ncbi:MAG: hypothetical protein PWR03_1974 [Tenuifilum sp.]|jgi:hypothetical protein|nr:hypothetical protein [Tenuifilum sp.]
MIMTTKNNLYQTMQKECKVQYLLCFENKKLIDYEKDNNFTGNTSICFKR